MNIEHETKVIDNALKDFRKQGGRCIPPIYRKALRHITTAVIQNTKHLSGVELDSEGTLYQFVDAIICDVYNPDTEDEVAIKVMEYRTLIASVIATSPFCMTRFIQMMNE